MQVIKVWEDARPAEKGDGREAITEWSAIVSLIGKANCKGP